MNVEITPMKSTSNIILILLNITFLPLGILLLLNLDKAAKQWHEKSKERSRTQFIFIFGHAFKGYTSVKWNRFIFILIGITGILIGSISMVYLVISLTQ